MMEKSYIEKKCEDISCNIEFIRQRIAEAAVKSGRKPEDIRFMAVTKTVEPVFINHALSCGIDLIGENKVQEFLEKKDSLKLDGVEKHLIGHLQTNKVKKIVGEVDMIESVDSVKLAAEIGKESVKKGITTDILIEVNVGNEESKTGLKYEQAESVVDQIAEIQGVRIRGLMTIPPICENKVELSEFFINMRKLFIDISTKKRDNIRMDILSMGMSGDYSLAIECGSNLVRVGSAIFGARNYNKQ